jgi:hypothetical protein
VHAACPGLVRNALAHKYLPKSENRKVLSQQIKQKLVTVKTGSLDAKWRQSVGSRLDIMCLPATRCPLLQVYHVGFSLCYHFFLIYVEVCLFLLLDVLFYIFILRQQI